MTEEFKTYYEFFKAELEKYRGDYEDYIFYLPELFSLLCELLNSDVDKPDRLRISAALGYFVAPKDVIHEEIYGPAGYIDDIFLCCYTLNKLQKKYGMDMIKKYWYYKEDYEKVFDECYTISSRFIDDENLKDSILKFVGLK
jgi:uncharacterized membrane protein YkvA (DUF1232 family)